MFMRASPVLEAEEDQPVPLGAGDGAGNGRQRLVGAALVLEVVVPHRDAVLDALVLPDQPRAGDRPRVGAHLPLRLAAAVQFLAQLLQPPHRLGLQAAIGQFLDAVGEPALEVAPVEGRRLGLEQIAPLLLQLPASAWSSAPPGAPGWGRESSCRSPLDVRVA